MEFHREALEIVLAAGRELTGRRGADHIKEKGHTDYVTEVDVRVQQFIFRELSKIDPGAQFLGEEKDNSGVDMNGRVWILDPVDGTTNFIHDFQHSVVSLACSEREGSPPALSMTPYRRECFEAQEGAGCLSSIRSPSL